MHVEALGSQPAAVFPRSASSPAGRRRPPPVLLATAVAAALLPGAARAQFEPFAEVDGPSGVAVADTGDVAAVVGAPSSLVQFAPDGTRVAELPLPDELARSRIAVSLHESFRGGILLSPAGRLEIVPDADDVEGTAFELASAEDPIEVEAPDLDAAGAGAPVSLAGARFDDVAVAPPIAPAEGEPTLLELFVAGATAGTGDDHEGARPFLVRLRIDVAAKQAQIIGVATSQGDASDPRAPSGVGVAFEEDDTGAVAEALAVTSIPTATHATDEGAGWTLVTAGTAFPEDTRAEAAPQLVAEEQRIVSPGMTSDDAGNLYMIVSVGACEGSEGPGLRVVSPTETLCTTLPETTASGSADVGVARAGDPVYVNDEEGDAILVTAAPPNVTPPVASRSTSRAWTASAGASALR
jgi:hypothetical protein